MKVLLRRQDRLLPVVERHIRLVHEWCVDLVLWLGSCVVSMDPGSASVVTIAALVSVIVGT